MRLDALRRFPTGAFFVSTRSPRIYDPAVNSQAIADFEFVWQAMRRGAIPDLALASRTIAGFPAGKDALLGRHWIATAIDSGSLIAVQ